jgi:hypothetical protein
MSDETSPLTTIREAARAEKRLLREEYEAELVLVEAREALNDALRRLAKEEERVVRRREQVTAAIENLRRARDARAAGPAIAEPPAPVVDIQTAPPPKDDSRTTRRRKSTPS